MKKDKASNHAQKGIVDNDGPSITVIKTLALSHETK